MSRKPLYLAALAMLAASPATAGPPWIAIEYPANPHHASTRGAALLVRAYHHSTALALPISGTAEGMVKGKRVSRRLDLRPTNIEGVYALRGELPVGDAWVLAIRLEQGENSTATALVTLDGQGGIARVEVPSTRSADGWTVPRPVNAGDLERALQVAAGHTPASTRFAGADEASDAGATALLASVLGLPLLLGLAARRRRSAR